MGALPILTNSDPSMFSVLACQEYECVCTCLPPGLHTWYAAQWHWDASWYSSVASIGILGAAQWRLGYLVQKKLCGANGIHGAALVVLGTALWQLGYSVQPCGTNGILGTALWQLGYSVQLCGNWDT